MTLEEGSWACHLPEERLDALHRQLVKEEFCVFRLESISSRADFVRVIKEHLPLNPPIVLGVWEAINDSLFNGIADLSERKIAIVWKDAHKLMDAEDEEFAIAINVLISVVEDLKRECEKTLRVYLVDDGKYFNTHQINKAYVVHLHELETEK